MKQLVCLLIFSQITIALLAQNKLVHLQNSPEEYKALGIMKDTVKPWENGSRTTIAKGNFEWWYYDAHLDDGSNVVISFHMRDAKKLNKAISPYISVDINLANGKKIERNIRCKATEFKSSTSTCDVHIGNNYFTGDLKQFKIHIDDTLLKMDIKFNNSFEAWRPKTGYLNFGLDSNYFAWLVPVPEGKTDVSYSYKGVTTNTKGICYHDHNWGNKSLEKLAHNWYWAVASLGQYKVLATEIIAEKKYNYEPQLFFAVFKDGKLLVDDEKKVTPLRSYGITQTIGNKPVSDVLSYTYNDKNVTYELTLKRQKFIASLTIVKGNLTRKLVKLLTGFDGAYYRMLGNATLNVYEKECLTDHVTSDKALWELFYFGNPY